jgi:hypothetical protein
MELFRSLATGPTAAPIHIALVFLTHVDNLPLPCIPAKGKTIVQEQNTVIDTHKDKQIAPEAISSAFRSVLTKDSLPLLHCKALFKYF